MSRVYLDVPEQRARLRLLRDRLGGLEDDDREPERQLPAPRRNALGLPFEATWERILLLLVVVWFVWRFFKGMRKSAKTVKQLRRQVRALTAAQEVIDV